MCAITEFRYYTIVSSIRHQIDPNVESFYTNIPCLRERVLACLTIQMTSLARFEGADLSTENSNF